MFSPDILQGEGGRGYFRLSAQTRSAALRADAAESALCGYLSLIALLGLLVNAVWH